MTPEIAPSAAAEADCPYCAKGSERECGHVNVLYGCTRETGHSGPHVACGFVTMHDKRRWDDDGNTAYQEDPLS